MADLSSAVALVYTRTLQSWNILVLSCQYYKTDPVTNEDYSNVPCEAGVKPVRVLEACKWGMVPTE